MFFFAMKHFIRDFRFPSGPGRFFLPILILLRFAAAPIPAQDESMDGEMTETETAENAEDISTEKIGENASAE